jgi:alanyl-tRNA synthetase
MTERLYYTDSYLREFRARVVDRSADGRRVYLDRTAFYPSSGGQPFDTGSIAGVPVIEVAEEDDRLAHVTSAPLAATDVECAIDWERRFDHMQQHTGQHLLSAVFAARFGLQTASFHLGQEFSTIDLEAASIEAATLGEAERRANAAVCEDRPVSVAFAEAGSAADLRKPSERRGALRIVSIEGLDRSACGGTHVRRTGEIGPILIRKMEKVRNTVRIEFLCGLRAVRRARADFEALSRAARLFSAALDEVPALLEAQLESARAADKQRRKLEAELAGYQGRELYDAAEPDAGGTRRLTRRLAAGSLEDLRALAQSFTARPRAIFVGALEQPPAVLLAVSADAGLDAGKLVKATVGEAGGRGGGNARIAQGSLPSAAALETALERIEREI